MVDILFIFILLIHNMYITSYPSFISLNSKIISFPGIHKIVNYYQIGLINKSDNDDKLICFLVH